MSFTVSRHQGGQNVCLFTDSLEPEDNIIYYKWRQIKLAEAKSTWFRVRVRIRLIRKGLCPCRLRVRVLNHLQLKSGEQF